MNVYMDDVRPGPNSFSHDDNWSSWVVVRSVHNTKKLLQWGQVNHLSLDHDMGEGQESGYDLVKWMAENDIWPTGEITVHSANPVGAENMRATIERYRKAKNG